MHRRSPPSPGASRPRRLGGTRPAPTSSSSSMSRARPSMSRAPAPGATRPPPWRTNDAPEDLADDAKSIDELIGTSSPRRPSKTLSKPRSSAGAAPAPGRPSRGRAASGGRRGGAAGAGRGRAVVDDVRAGRGDGGGRRSPPPQAAHRTQGDWGQQRDAQRYPQQRHDGQHGQHAGGYRDAPGYPPEDARRVHGYDERGDYDRRPPVQQEQYYGPPPGPQGYPQQGYDYGRLEERGPPRPYRRDAPPGAGPFLSREEEEAQARLAQQQQQQQQLHHPPPPHMGYPPMMGYPMHPMMGPMGGMMDPYSAMLLQQNQMQHQQKLAALMKSPGSPSSSSPDTRKHRHKKKKHHKKRKKKYRKHRSTDDDSSDGYGRPRPRTSVSSPHRRFAYSQASKSPRPATSASSAPSRTHKLPPKSQRDEEWAARTLQRYARGYIARKQHKRPGKSSPKKKKKKSVSLVPSRREHKPLSSPRRGDRLEHPSPSRSSRRHHRRRSSGAHEAVRQMERDTARYTSAYDPEDRHDLLRSLARISSQLDDGLEPNDPNQLEQVKLVLDQFLASNHIYDRIRAVVSSYAAPLADDGESTEAGKSVEVIDRLITDLKRARLRQAAAQRAGGTDTLGRDEFVYALPSGSASASVLPASSLRLKRGHRYLFVRLNPGKAFIDHMAAAAPGDEDDFDQLRASGDEGKTLRVVVQFGTQRMESKPVPASVEPAFNDYFLFELPRDLDSLASESAPDVLDPMESLLTVAHPLRMAVVCESVGGGRELVATVEVEWRRVLVHGRMSLPVELIGGDHEAELRVPMGLLDLDLEVLPLHKLPPRTTTTTQTRKVKRKKPKKDKKKKKGGDEPDESEEDEEEEEVVEKTHVHLPVYVEKTHVERQIQREHKRQMLIDRRFHTYVTAWWREYQRVRASHQHRLIKLFARNEHGKQRFACTYLKPLRAGRLLDSPLHAARFVSLIPFERGLALGGARREVWNSTHTLLAKRFGDVEDHALLLCSLLLGFGLDAYCVVGATAEGSHMWVMTRSSHMQPADGDAGKGHVASVIFWDAVTGRRYDLVEALLQLKTLLRQGAPSAAASAAAANRILPFRTVHCVFNHRQLYANNQANDAVSATNWSLEDSQHWRSVNRDAIKALEQQAVQPPLCPSSIDANAEAERLETALKQLVAQYRAEQLSLDTVWDAQFSYVLTPALAAYESERTIGHDFGNAEFQAAVKHTIRRNHVFKGFPFQFNHRSPTRMLAAMVKSSTGCLDMLQTAAHHTRFGVRVKVVLYPEDVCAVWVMLAAKHREELVEE